MAASPQESHRARFLEQALERNPVHRDALRAHLAARFGATCCCAVWSPFSGHRSIGAVRAA
jgi:hypothetical protein